MHDEEQNADGPGRAFDESARNCAARPNVLLIEDDPELSSAIIKELRRRDYGVAYARSGSEGIEKAREAHFDVLILDRMLPQVDGITIIKSLRSAKIATPVLIISALDDVTERVLGLEAGADDYLIKPFSFAEMGARIEALLRRPAHTSQTRLQAGPLVLDLLERVAILNGGKIDLSKREFQILQYFMERPGQLITKNMLLQKVWKYKFIPQTNVVDVHISKLRQKLETHHGGTLIKNIRGQGYILDQDA
jgi:two-component system OmpR family response regulator